MPKPYTDLSSLAPEMFLTALAFVVLVADLVLPSRWRKEVAALAGFGLLAALAPTLWIWGHGPTVDFSGALLVDNFSVILDVVFILAGAMTVLMSADYFMHLRRGFGEFFALIVFFVLALCMMPAAGDLVVLYIAFELSSITGYVLAAWLRDDPKSNESGMKYFVYGAAASGVMLFGMTLLYGLTGTLEIRALAGRLEMQPTVLGAVGAAMLLAGFGYKIAMWPFHWWAPDVYEGAPTPVTAFLSVGPKLAGIAILIRLLQAVQATAPLAWPVALAVLAALTMFAGNLMALRQQNVKRMLAYSSIAQAGYMLIGVVVALYDPFGLEAVLFYAGAYLMMNLGAFAVALIVEAETGSSLIEAFGGLSRRAPGLAVAMAVFLLALTGIPPTGGFVGKLLLFGAAIKVPRLTTLAVIGIVNSAISLYYYMNIARAMYFGEEARPPVRKASLALTVAVVVALGGTLIMGLLPQNFTALAQLSARALASL